MQLGYCIVGMTKTCILCNHKVSAVKGYSTLMYSYVPIMYIMYIVGVFFPLYSRLF